MALRPRFGLRRHAHVSDITKILDYAFYICEPTLIAHDQAEVFKFCTTRTIILERCHGNLVSPEHSVSHAYTKSSSLSSSLLTHVGAPSHRGLLDAAPLAARVRGCSQVVQHDSDPALCTVHAAQTQSAGGVALRRLLHATQTLSPSSFSMVHVVHVQPDAELDSVLEAVLDAVLDAVLGAVFLAAGGAGVAAVPGVGRRGLLPPFASIFSAVRRSSGLVVLAMTAKQRTSTALWLGGCSDIRVPWKPGGLGRRAGRSQGRGRAAARGVPRELSAPCRLLNKGLKADFG